MAGRVVTGPDQLSADAGWESMRALDPEFAETCVRLAEVPRRSGRLEPKVRALIALAVDANVTHLDADGVRRQIREALAAGATPGEVMEVLECAATVSVHAMNLGVPLLAKVLRERGDRTQPTGLSEHQRQLKSEFARQRGYWNATWDAILELAPEMFAAYTEFSAHPWRTGRLSPLVKELVYIAFDTSATHLYPVGLELHIENALRYGGTAEEVLEVMEIAVLIGMKSVLLGAPILQEEVAAAGAATRP